MGNKNDNKKTSDQKSKKVQNLLNEGNTWSTDTSDIEEEQLSSIKNIKNNRTQVPIDEEKVHNTASKVEQKLYESTLNHSISTKEHTETKLTQDQELEKENKVLKKLDDKLEQIRNDPPVQPQEKPSIISPIQSQEKPSIISKIWKSMKKIWNVITGNTDTYIQNTYQSTSSKVDKTVENKKTGNEKKSLKQRDKELKQYMLKKQSINIASSVKDISKASDVTKDSISKDNSLQTQYKKNGAFKSM